MLLQHITLATGHITTHRLDLITPEALRAVRGLLPGGGMVPGFPAFRVEIHAPLFTVWRGGKPLLTCGVGHGPTDPVWTALAELQARFLPVAAQPPSGAWLAVVLLPALALTAKEDIGWLADFERCVAAALLTK